MESHTDCLLINGKKYRFGAYSNGGNKIENAEFNATSRVLTFPNYSVDNTKDLIVAIPQEVTAKKLIMVR